MACTLARSRVRRALTAVAGARTRLAALVAASVAVGCFGDPPGVVGSSTMATTSDDDPTAATTSTSSGSMGSSGESSGASATVDGSSGAWQSTSSTGDATASSTGGGSSGNADPCAGEHRVVFVSSIEVSGALLSGLDVCDNAMGLDPHANAACICNGLWGGAGGDDDRVFAAWLSTSMNSAADLIAPVDLPYCRPDGMLVADGADALLDPSVPLVHPINVDEQLEAVDSSIWTGTSASGEAKLQTCGDWTGNGDGRLGLSSSTDVGWTFDMIGPCSNANLPIYCFEV